MKDYWKDLKINEAWSPKQKYNIILNYIESKIGSPSGTSQSLVEEDEDVSTIHVTVLDKDGNGINNASVQIRDNEHTYEGNTGTQGGCNISDVPYGEYTILAEATGYEENVDNITVNNESMDVSITLESTTTEEDNDLDVGITGETPAPLEDVDDEI